MPMQRWRIDSSGGPVAFGVHAIGIIPAEDGLPPYLLATQGTEDVAAIPEYDELPNEPHRIVGVVATGCHALVVVAFDRQPWKPITVQREDG